MNDTIAKQRDTIRKTIRAARKALTNEAQKQASNKLLDTLITHPKILAAKRVSVTLAYDGEIDLTPFIAWCWQQDKHVYLPVVHPTEIGQLVFVEYKANTKMELNRYGIKEPKLEIQHTHFINACASAELDIVFTPLVAFDQHGNRIGMGGGYYDRLLTPWFEKKIGPYPIGLAHDCQYVDILPIQNWDVPLPEIITPAHHFHF